MIKKEIKNRTKKISKPKLKKTAAEKIDDVKRLVELLMVNQIELEHQNQELRITQEELEASRNQYVNLYDFSPVPYLSFDKESIIKEVNLIACKMFNIDRNKFVGKRFINFIPLDERDIFNKFINEAFSSDIKISCEINIVNKDKRVFHVRMEGLKLEDALQKVQKCQVALIEL